MLSAMWPCIHGIMAPPTIAVLSSPEASPVNGPNPSMPNVKMVGNMMELKKPIARMLIMATWPVVAIEMQTSKAAMKAFAVSTIRGETWCRT